MKISKYKLIMYSSESYRLKNIIPSELQQHEAEKSYPHKKGMFDFITSWFVSNIKILPQESTNQDDITTYIRCIFHDFRGPLNNISLGTEDLLNTIDKNSEEFTTVESIKESCIFLSESLDGFLNVNNLNDSKIAEIQLKYQPFNIVGLIKKIQYILLSSIMKKKLEIKYNILPIQEWVMGDSKHIQHVLMNLLSNAIKFSVINSAIEIKLEGRSLETSKQHVLISIIDDNTFIMRNIRSHLFEKFNTSNNQEGTGLGLYICKKIIESHGGIINHFYKNDCTQGNIFRVELFLDVCTSSEGQQKILDESRRSKNVKFNEFKKKIKRTLSIHSSQHKVLKKNENNISNKNTKMFLQNNIIVTDDISNDHNKVTIMVVDDSNLTRKFMTRMIQQNYLEYKIYDAEDGLDALIKMIHFNEIGKKINILFVDNVMPNINGELFCKILRRIGYEGIIVGITGNGIKKDRQQYLDNGADYIYVKPFTKDNLMEFTQFVKKEGYESKKDKKIVNINGVLEWV